MADEDSDTQLMVRREATIMLLKKGKCYSTFARFLFLAYTCHSIHRRGNLRRLAQP